MHLISLADDICAPVNGIDIKTAVQAEKLSKKRSILSQISNANSVAAGYIKEYHGMDWFRVAAER